MVSRRRVLVNGFLMVLASLGHAASSAAGVGFSGPKPHPVGTKPFAAAVGDFNRDSNQDIAVVNYGSSDVVSMSGSNGFNSQVSVNITGLPGGVRATPLQFNVNPGAQQTVTVE